MTTERRALRGEAFTPEQIEQAPDSFVVATILDLEDLFKADGDWYEMRRLTFQLLAAIDRIIGRNRGFVWPASS